MRYLIIHNNEAFLTDWYEYENHYMEGMIITNTLMDKISFDGLTWQEITEDRL